MSKTVLFLTISDSTKKGILRYIEHQKGKLPPAGNLYSYAGMTRFRFKGYNLSPEHISGHP